MTLSTWLAVVLLCVAGAVTPGPSVALVLKHTLAGGRRAGITTGIAHAAGIGIYAFVSVLGLGFLLTRFPHFHDGLRWAGFAFLLWLGLASLLAKPQPATAAANHHHGHPARDGFLMAFLNPAAFVFFFALFSQLVTAATPLPAKLAYALTATCIDMGWYVSVAWLFSRPAWLARLERHALLMERLFGVLLLGTALTFLRQ